MNNMLTFESQIDHKKLLDPEQPNYNPALFAVLLEVYLKHYEDMK